MNLTNELSYAPPNDETLGETVTDLRRRVARIEKALNFSDQIEPRTVREILDEVEQERHDWIKARRAQLSPDLDDFGNPWTERDLELWAEAAKHDGSDVGDC